ncbi:MAG: glutamate-5-semialdehyde dehydrogenase [Candidatus Omnitrophota bacterium]
MKLKNEIARMAALAREAARSLAVLSPREKNRLLRKMAYGLARNKSLVLKANARDVAAAHRSGLSRAFIERLTLNQKRIKEMTESLLAVAALKDPVGEVIREWKRPNGLRIRKVRVPIGVAAIIYESRPNVTADCIGLCFKSGNAVILKGGSDALNSNLAIYRILGGVLKNEGVCPNAINLITTRERRAVNVLLGLNDYIDVVIPRGGEGLIRNVVRLSRIPVIKHYKGVCHVYVDDWADLNMAERVCFNAKVQRPGVCNAMESMLVHRDVAVRFLPGMLKKFRDAGVQIRGCPATQRIVKGLRRATEEDYRREYLDLILSVKVVGSLNEAIEHINNYGSHHSDSIITDNRRNGREFLSRVDSACVYVNASTRFTDGYQFGMGAEIGISTDKLHARGPMALEELTTYKYQVFGSGQVRQ